MVVCVWESLTACCTVLLACLFVNFEVFALDWQVLFDRFGLQSSGVLNHNQDYFKAVHNFIGCLRFGKFD